MSKFDRQNLKKAPKKAFRVSDHALERFRERVDEEFRHRSNDDLADLLNDRMSASDLTRDVTDPRCPDHVTTLYRLHSRTEEMQVAVVRQGVVVTVLDEWMANNNYPNWNSLVTHPFAKLATVTPIIVRDPAPAPDDYISLAHECKRLGFQLAMSEKRLEEMTADVARQREIFETSKARLVELMGVA